MMFRKWVTKEEMLKEFPETRNQMLTFDEIPVWGDPLLEAVEQMKEIMNYD